MDPATTAKLTTLGQQRRRAQQVVKATTAQLRPVVLKAHDEGHSEVEIARLTGLSRLTVRVWLGKKRT